MEDTDTVTGGVRTPGELPDMPSKAVVMAAASLPFGPEAAGLARRRLREWCEEWQVPREIGADAELAVSELVTNVLAYARAPVWLSAALVEDGATLVIDVYDATPVTQVLRDVLSAVGDPPEPGDVLSDAGADLPIGGRGLPLIAVLAKAIDVLPHPRAGKTMRALFAVVRTPS